MRDDWQELLNRIDGLWFDSYTAYKEYMEVQKELIRNEIVSEFIDADGEDVETLVLIFERFKAMK